MEIKTYLKSFFTAHWSYLAVSTACRLDIFDAIGDGKSLQKIAEALNLDEKNLKILLNALVSSGFLIVKGNIFCLNEKSGYLTEAHPESLKYASRNWTGDHLTAFQNLDHVIQTGKNVSEKLFGKTWFKYLNDNPEKLDDYHKAMYEYARDDYVKLPEVIDFSQHKSVMDVGGGYGAAINFIKNAYPQIECSLFDLENVIANVKENGITKVGGDFFENIPLSTEAIIMTRVLHDWEDLKALAILKNCFKALPEEGTLYLVENCSDKTEADLSLLSLNMAAMCESFERTSTEYISLCREAGLSFISEKQLNDLQPILIFEK